MPDYYQGPDGPVPVMRKPIIASGAGMKTIIAGVPGKRIRVLAIQFSLNLTNVIQVFSGLTTPITGLMNLAANQPFNFTTPIYGIWETEVGDPLNFNLIGAAQVLGGSLLYVTV